MSSCKRCNFRPSRVVVKVSQILPKPACRKSAINSAELSQKCGGLAQNRFVATAPRITQNPTCRKSVTNWHAARVWPSYRFGAPPEESPRPRGVAAIRQGREIGLTKVVTWNLRWLLSPHSDQAVAKRAVLMKYLLAGCVVLVQEHNGIRRPWSSGQGPF